MQRIPSTRRDERFPIRPGGGSVEFRPPDADRGSLQGELTLISAAGLAFETVALIEDLTLGARLTDVMVRVGSCELAGEAVVRDVKPCGPGRVQLGCLFYPSSVELENLWMGVLEGVKAVARP